MGLSVWMDATRGQFIRIHGSFTGPFTARGARRRGHLVVTAWQRRGRGAGLCGPKTAVLALKRPACPYYNAIESRIFHHGKR